MKIESLDLQRIYCGIQSLCSENGWRLNPTTSLGNGKTCLGVDLKEDDALRLVALAGALGAVEPKASGWGHWMVLVTWPTLSLDSVPIEDIESFDGITLGQYTIFVFNSGRSGGVYAAKGAMNKRMKSNLQLNNCHCIGEVVAISEEDAVRRWQMMGGAKP